MEEVGRSAGEETDGSVDDDIEHDETRSEHQELESHGASARIDELWQKGDTEERHLWVEQVREQATLVGAVTGNGWLLVPAHAQITMSQRTYAEQDKVTGAEDPEPFEEQRRSAKESSQANR